jgi:ribonuclease P protein component
MNQGLTKYERLKSRKQTDLLFKSRSQVFVHPVKYVWCAGRAGQAAPVEVLFNVSKRNFKRAVDRNRIKRLMREVYRKNKTILYDCLKEQNHKISLAMLYVAKDLPEYHKLEKALLKALHKLCEEIKTTEE